MSSQPLGTLWKIPDFFLEFLTSQEIYKETVPKQNLELFYPLSRGLETSHMTQHTLLLLP